MGLICTLTFQQVPFFPLGVSQASKQREHAERKSACPISSQTCTVITFPWFLLYDSCVVNIAAHIHYLIFCLPVLSFSSPLGECQSTMCGLLQSAVNSCWVLLHCLFLAHCCMILPSGLKRLPPFHCDSLWFAVILIKEKRQCAWRDTFHAVEYHGGLSSVALVVVGLSHMEIKVNVTGDWGLWSLSDDLGWSRLDLSSVESVSVQRTE